MEGIEVSKNQTVLSEYAINIAEAFSTAPPALDFVLPGFLAGTVGLLASPGAIGKTWVALELGCAVASRLANAQLLNLPIPKSGKVVFLSAEDPAVALQQRLHAIGKFLTIEAREEVAASLQVISLVGQHTDLSPEVNDKGVPCGEDWSDTIAEQCKGVRLIVLDTLSRWHSKEENSNRDMALLLKVAEWLAAVTGAAVLFLNHSSKSMIIQGRGDEQQSVRGASALVDNARWQAAVCGMSEAEAKGAIPALKPADRIHFRRLVVTKQNHGMPLPDVWLMRKEGGVLVRVEIGQNPLQPIGGTRQTAANGRMWRGKA